MLRTRVQRTTGTTGAVLSVTHALGAVPDLWALEPVSGRSLNRTYVTPGTPLTNMICIQNDIQTTCTMDVFVWSYQGRLY